MSARALEFVETWVSEKIEEIELPEDTEDSQVKALAADCIQAAQEEGIPQSEIQEAFDDLAAFIGGEIEEAKDRAEDEDDEDDEDEDEDDDEKTNDKAE